MNTKKYKHYGTNILLKGTVVALLTGLHTVEVKEVHAEYAVEAGALQADEGLGNPRPHRYERLFAGAVLSDSYLECLERARLGRRALELKTVTAMAQALPGSFEGILLSEEDFAALARIVQAEAGGEKEKGKILVAQVILNRVMNENFADSVIDVIFENIGGSTQFSPTKDGRYYSVTVSEESKAAVEKAIHGEDVSQGALYFSARSEANPNDMQWFDQNLKWLFQYGGHEFYTLP